MNKIIFLDRDGVINKKLDNDYVKNWEEFVFLPKAIDAIKKPVAVVAFLAETLEKALHGVDIEKFIVAVVPTDRVQLGRLILVALRPSCAKYRIDADNGLPLDVHAQVVGKRRGNLTVL